MPDENPGPVRAATSRREALRALAAALALGAVGCGAPGPGPGTRLRRVVGGASRPALLGVAVAPEVSVAGGEAMLDAWASAAFRRAGARRFELPDGVREEIDPERLEAIVAGFGRTGALVPTALQTLMAAPISHRRALLLRVEENRVRRLDPVSELVPGRPRVRRVVQAVRRRVRVSGTGVDLNGGAVRPLGSWTTDAEARTEHVSEGGDGFVASVAATLAGRMTGRPGAPPPPEPPPAGAAFDALFEDLARDLPGA